MKSKILIISILAVIFSACASDSTSAEWVTVKGNKFIDPQGNELIFRGLCFSDPVKLVSEGQWNERYFAEAADWEQISSDSPYIRPILTEWAGKRHSVQWIRESNGQRSTAYM